MKNNYNIDYFDLFINIGKILLYKLILPFLSMLWFLGVVFSDSFKYSDLNKPLSVGNNVLIFVNFLKGLRFLILFVVYMFSM